MNDQLDDPAAWEECPDGEFQRVDRRIERKQRQRTVRMVIGGAAGLVVLIALTGMPFLGQRGAMNEMNFGGITCSDVKVHAESYVSKVLQADLVAQITDHRKLCPHCDRMLRKLESPQTRFTRTQNEIAFSQERAKHVEPADPGRVHLIRLPGNVLVRQDRLRSETIVASTAR